jgi:glutamine synthetase
LFALPLKEITDRGIRVVPATLADAIGELEGDDVLRQALGQVPGGDYIDYFAQTKRDEFSQYHRSVSMWEVERYLSLF